MFERLYYLKYPNRHLLLPRPSSAFEGYIQPHLPRCLYTTARKCRIVGQARAVVVRILAYSLVGGRRVRYSTLLLLRTYLPTSAIVQRLLISLSLLTSYSTSYTLAFYTSALHYYNKEFIFQILANSIKNN
jgi:hypothetical protein